MEGWLDDGIVPDQTEPTATPGDLNEGFTYYEHLVVIDTLFAELPECEVELPFRAETVTDALSFEIGKFGTNIDAGTVLKPQAVRVHPDGTVLFFFSVVDPIEPAEAGWLFGTDYKGLIDVVPDTYKALVYNFSRNSELSLSKVVHGNKVAVGNRRRIADAINNSLADHFATRAENLRKEREQAVQAHYETSEDTGMF